MNEVITCGKCEKKINIIHKCYAGRLENEPHELDGKPTCHKCWDDSFKSLVDNLGY